jgi:hypothetical protein
MDANIPVPGHDPGHEDPIGPELTALERRLASWQPSAGALDRDRMLYDAGRASVGVRPWRLAAAALLFATAGLGGLLVQQRSQLARERALLADERAHRRELETALAARTGSPRPASPVPATTEVPVIGPPSPSSYLVLTARLVGGDAASSGVGADPEPRVPARNPAGGPVHPSAIRPRDFRRVLEL